MSAYEEKTFKILIADENIQYRNSLATRLRLQGFNVEFATGGFHLLHLLERHKDYTLLIVDENMADMPAREIILLVRTMKNKTDLPILFISKIKNDEDINEMILNGANECILKMPNLQPIVETAKKYFMLLKNS